MKAQHYKFKLTPEHMEYAQSGQFVFKDNKSDVVTGFIDFVSDCELSIMLFEPAELPEDGIYIQEQCDYISRLREIFEEYPDIISLWLEN